MSEVSWNQLGNDVNGDDTSDRFGKVVSLNGNGDIFASSMLSYYGSGSPGIVRVFKRDTNISDNFTKT